jgi:hypothetical protein
MDWLLIFVFVGVFVLGYLIGNLNGSVGFDDVKSENERLNAELKTLTDRDSKGRFTGSKKRD